MPTEEEVYKLLNNEEKENSSDDENESLKKSDDDWMNIQNDSNLNDINLNKPLDEIVYWSQDSFLYEEKELIFLKNWIKNLIKNDPSLNDSRESLKKMDKKDLNEMQTMGYEMIMDSILNKKQCLIRIDGSGGVGKSHLINTLRSNLKSNQIKLCSFTGKAANLINGQTINSLFHIIPKNFKKLLAGKILNDFQTEFLDVDVIVVDEYSMLGCKLLAYFEYRCREAKANNLPFGGLSIILTGDYYQIPPIGDRVLWNSKKPNETLSEYVMIGLALFASFKKIVHLTENIRQQDPIFQSILARLRIGKSTVEDWHVLSTRIVGLANNEHEFGDCQYIMAYKKEVNEHNILAVEKIQRMGKNQFACRINALHNEKGCEKIDEELFNGLKNNLLLIRGARVVINNNIWTSQGLINGTIGYVRHILFEPNKKPPDLPFAVIVEVEESYNGPHLKNKIRYVSINPITSFMYNRNKKRIERTQLPLDLSFALTIHKCQGSTLNHIKINLGKFDLSPGSAYVALSRARSLENILIEGWEFGSSRLTNIQKPEYMNAFEELTSQYIKQTRKKYLEFEKTKYNKKKINKEKNMEIELEKETRL